MLLPHFPSVGILDLIEEPPYQVFGTFAPTYVVQHYRWNYYPLIYSIARIPKYFLQVPYSYPGMDQVSWATLLQVGDSATPNLPVLTFHPNFSLLNG